MPGVVPAIRRRLIPTVGVCTLLSSWLSYATRKISTPYLVDILAAVWPDLTYPVMLISYYGMARPESRRTIGAGASHDRARVTPSLRQGLRARTWPIDISPNGRRSPHKSPPHKVASLPETGKPRAN